MTLSIICSPLNGILESNVYAWFVHQTGVASNIAQTTVPFFLGASAFGAANGFIEQTTYSPKEKVKKDLLSDNHNLQTAADLFQFTLTLASRYAIAIACKELLNLEITTNYIHLLNNLNAAAYTSSLPKTGFFVFGLVTAISAKYVSLFVDAPFFKNAYYFGVANIALYHSLGNYPDRAFSFIKKSTEIENPKILFISRLFLTIPISTATYFTTASLAKKYCNITVSSNYIAASLLFGFRWILLISFASHFVNDFILDVDFKQVAEDVSRRRPGAKRLADQLKQVFENSAPPNQAILEQQIRNGLFNEEVEAFRALEPQLRSFLSNIYDNWKQGLSLQQIIVEVIVSQSTEELFDPILKAVNKAITPQALLNRGTEHITQDILKNASQITLQAFRTRNEDRNTVQFITTQAVCIYTVGDKKDEEIPYFFSLQTI